jgi:hypothetical protein
MNIKELLDKHGVQWFSEGTKNVSHGWIGLKCPVCGDNSCHLGVNLSTGKTTCFRCGKKNLAWILHLILHCTYSQAKTYVKKLGFDENASEKFQEELTGDREAFDKLFSSFSTTLPSQHYDYLASRKFDVEHVAKKYQLRATSNSGKYKFRVIAPIFYQNQIVNFVGRDITNTAEQRYKFCPNSISIMRREKVVYNLHTIRDRFVVVEGAPGVWRCEDGFVATFGTMFSLDQVLLLVKTGAKRAFTCYDPEPKAQERAKLLALSLLAFFPEVINIDLGEGVYPDELTSSDVIALRKEVFR